MTLQLSTAVRNARLNAVETQLGTAPLLRILSGAEPATCAAAQTGTVLCEIALPSDWMADATSGSKAKSGVWSGTGAAAGTAGYFRLLDSGATTCHLQGSITITGSGGDMTFDNPSLTVGQAVSVNAFTLADANA